MDRRDDSEDLDFMNLMFAIATVRFGKSLLDLLNHTQNLVEIEVSSLDVWKFFYGLGTGLVDDLNAHKRPELSR